MTKMLYDKGNYIGMKNDMGKINWSKAFKDCEQNGEEQYRIFLTELKKLEKKYIFQEDITVVHQRQWRQIILKVWGWGGKNTFV